MTKPRFTIAGLIVFIGAIALIFAAMRSPTLLISQVAITASLTVLLASIVAAVVSRPRAFWIGFAIFGWAYLLLSLGPWCDEHVRPWLLSTRFLDEIFLRTIGPSLVTRGLGIRRALPFDGPALSYKDHLEYLRFHETGHLLGSVAHGIMGGLLGLWLHRGRTIPSASRPVGVEPA